MRETFFQALESIGYSHDDVYLLTADLGFKLFDSFRENRPDNFIDIGVAESNMIGIAAGMALCNKKVYCYSIIPFLIMRAYEHIRMDIAYNNLDVRLVGVGGGFTYGMEGFSHFALEDLSIMRMLPNMSIVIPADRIEAKLLAEASYHHEGPMYIRLGRTGDPVVHSSYPTFKIGKVLLLEEGEKIAFLATGSMVSVAQQVTKRLQDRGLKATLVDIHTLKPLDVEVIRQISSRHDAVFTLEEHYASGGFGSAIAEVLIEAGYRGLFKRYAVPDTLNQCTGSSEWIRGQYGLTADSIYQNVVDSIKAVGIMLK